MQELRKLLIESKNYILMAVFIFGLGWWLGATFTQAFEAIIAFVLSELADIIEEIKNEGASQSFMAWYIFQNNVRAALTMMVVGSVLFIVPLISLFINGVAVGYILQAVHESDLSSWSMFLYGILPHGILELPAIFVAGGVGTFLGMRLLKWLFGKDQFVSHWLGSKREGLGSFWAEQTYPVFLQRLRGVFFLGITIVAVLLVAALVESYITPMLLERFVLENGAS